MRIRRRPRGEEIGETPGTFAAGDSASRLAEEAPRLLARAAGTQWYERPGNEVDLAAYALCRLRRARAGEHGSHLSGDEAVRQALAQAEPEALVWLASRTVSYMDENGFPEDVAPWIPQESR